MGPNLSAIDSHLFYFQMPKESELPVGGVGMLL
jgi:hypothetical protein